MNRDEIRAFPPSLLLSKAIKKFAMHSGNGEWTGHFFLSRWESLLAISGYRIGFPPFI